MLAVKKREAEDEFYSKRGLLGYQEKSSSQRNSGRSDPFRWICAGVEKGRGGGQSLAGHSVNEEKEEAEEGEEEEEEENCSWRDDAFASPLA